MSSKRRIRTTAQELAYREKHFHDIRVVKDRQIACTSCGIELKIELAQIFYHPLLGILQCETCWYHFNKVIDKSNVENTEKYCYICGNNKKLYKCANENCDSIFCKKCIKKKVNLSLLDAEKEDWKCFICYSKPIWELRAVCATVMDSFPKKGNRRNTNKIKRCFLPSEKQQFKKSKELRIILQKLCDRDDDNNSDERPLHIMRSIQKTNNKDRCIKRDSSSVLQEIISEIDLTDSVSESSIASESLSISCKQYKQRKKRRDCGAKFMQSERDSNSSLLQKISKFDEEGTDTSKKNRIHIDSDNDSTDVSSNKKTKRKRIIKSNIKIDKKVKGKINSYHRTASSDIESDQNDSTNTTLNVFKSLPKDITQENKKKDAKSYDTKLTKKKTKKIHDLTSESEDEDIVDKKQNRKKRFIKRIISSSSTDEEKRGKYDKFSKKQLSNIQEDNSDASSSKEFQKVKLQKIHRNKYSARRLVNLKVDYTGSPIVANPLNEKSKKGIDRQSNLNPSDAKEVLQECKKICSNFQLYMNSIEQLYGKEDEEKLILKSTEKINKLKLELEKKQKELTTFYQSLSHSCRGRKNSAAKKSHKEVSNDEQSLEEISICEERIVGENKLEISENKQRESKDISECDSEEIFSADEIWLQKMQIIRNKIDTSKTENDLNHNGTKIDDEDRALMNKSKDNDKNNVDSQDDLVASPVLGGLKEKKISMERSIKKQLSPECIKTNDNKVRLTKKDIDLMDEQRKLSTYISDNETEIEDSPLKSNNKKMTLQNDRQDSSTNQKDIINESTDMFDTSFDIVENAKENRSETEEIDVTANSDKADLSSQIECIDNNETSLMKDEDKVSSKKDTTLLSHNNEEGKDLSNQDKQAKVASTSRNENIHGVLEELDISEKANIDEIEFLDDAEALAKKTLLESDSDMSDNILTSASTIKQTEDLITNDTSLTGKKSESKDDNSDISSNTSTLILSMSAKKMNGVENPDSKAKTIVVENKSSGQPDKGSSKEVNFLDEKTKLEKATKKVLLESNSDDSTISLSLESESDEVSDKKTVSNSSRENVRAKQALLESSNSESSCSGIVVSEIETNISKSSKNSKRKLGNVENIVSPRVKRKKVKLDKNYHYRNDKKLRMSCEVRLVRLNKKILKRHLHQLLKSREYLEQKALKSLVNLDKLEKRHKRNVGNHSDTSTDNDSSAKISKSLNKQKEKQTIQNEESLMDHLKKVENGGVSVSAETDSDSDKSIHRKKIERVDAMPVSNEALLSEANRLAKENLLNSSDSNVEREVEPDGDNSINNEDEDENENMDEKKKKNQNKSERRTSIQDDNKKEESEKSNWRQNKILTMKFSDSDTDVEKEKWKKEQKIIAEESKKNYSDSDDKEKLFKSKKKTKAKRWILDSDSDIKFTDCSSDSDKSSEALNARQMLSDSDSVGKGKEKEKRKKRKHGDSSLSGTDSPFEEKKTKSKRKRIKKMISDSDSSDTEMKNSQGSAQGKSGRKNIRKVLKDKQVADDTKQAAKEEEERLKRIAERQALYNEMYEMRLAGEEKVEKLVLDFDTETKKELVSVHEELVKRLKPHQARGIKFMWDACFESLERIKTTSGSGCIIAHCMGLGKTLQVITLTHTLLTHEETGIKTVLVVCPLSTVLNWLNEYKTWLTDLDDINVYEMTKFKKNFVRRWHLQRWQRTGGVMIIGYEMFRNLTGANKNIKKAMKEAILEYLVDPGADLVICDEGHLLKNEDTALSKCMKRVKTLRRIVLTGTPLQNNLIEYHCMVQFVKPNLLGTKKEFLNRFVNPITNGQFDDSTAHDVKLMKKRAHVLHKMLEGSVQRFDYSVLTPFLPPKQEYVIFVRLTDAQIKMYRYYLDNFARRSGAGGSLFADFQALQRIWTHPIVLRLNAEKIEKANEKKGLSSDTEGSLKNFIDDDSTDVDTSSSDSSSDSDVQAIDDVKEKTEPNITKNILKRKTRNNSSGEEEVEEEKQEIPEAEWWSQFVQPEHFEDIRASTKLLLLFEILKECEQIGDKLLVFSQSLYSLTLIEEFLGRIDDQTQNGTSLDTLEGHTGSWSSGLDYFRLDGQTSAENRSLWCKIFNKPTNTRARLFLISTRAGGLGINLTAANRVIIFDASWNPSHDVQSIFRIYRFGQKKPCYVYRFLAAGTMEEKIYNRQVTKLSLSCRVVDEQQIERHYSNNDLNELYIFEGYSDKERLTLNLPKDRLLAEIFLKYKNSVENYHEHDSLLENKAEEELDEEERKQAWLEYEEEKKGKPLVNPMFNAAYQNNLLLQQYNMMNPGQSAGMLSQNMSAQLEYESLQQLIRKDYPNATPEQQQKMTQRALMEMYNYWEKQATLYTKQPMRNPATMQNFQQQIIMPQASNSNAQQISQLNQLLTSSGQLGNYLNVNKPAQPSVTQRADLLPNPFTYRNVPSANNKSGNAEDDIIEVIPTTSNAGTSNVQAAVQSSDKSKNQEE